jgi:phasin family protein
MPAKKTPSKPAARKSTVAKSAAPKSVAAKSVAAKPATPKPAAKLAPVAVAKTPAAKTPAAVPQVPAAVQPVEAAVAASQETIEAVVKAGSQAATKGYEQAVAIAQEQVEKASSKLFEGYDDVASLSKDSVDAYVASSTLLAKGVEALGKEMISFAQSTVESNLATTMAFFSAQTLQEAIDLQTDFSRSRLDTLVAESAKLTELSLALANDSFAPLQAQLNASVEKLMKPLAA